MAKDNDGLLISAGLDISQTLVNIQKDIQKINVELKNDKNARVRIVGGLNLAETTRLINANLATVSKGLKLDIGNVNIGSATNNLTSNFGNAASAAKDISSGLNNINNEVNNANISAKALDRTLANIDERFVKPIKPILSPDGIIDAEKTIERFENKFKSLGSVNAKAIYNDNASADSLAKIEVAVKSTTGEIRNLTFELDKTAQKFEYISSTYSDKGLFKNTSKNSTLQSTLEFLNRIEQRVQTINSHTLNQANPLKEGTEYYSNYDRQLQIVAQRIDEITSKNRVLSDEQKREIGMIVSYLQNYAKEQQKLAYPPMISSTDVGAQVQIATANLEKLKTQWSGQGVLIDSVQKRIDRLFTTLLGIGDTEGLKKFYTDLAILKNDVSSISSMSENLSKGLNEIRRLGSNSVFKKNISDVDVQSSITKLNELQTKYQQFQQVLSTAKSPGEIKKLSAGLAQIKPQFDSVISSAKNLQASLKDTNGAEKNAQKLRVLISQIEQYMAANSKAMRSNKTLGSGNTVAIELNNMLTALRANASPEEYQKIAANFRIVRNEVKMLGIEGKTMWGTIAASAKKFGQWMGITGSITRVLMYVRQTLTTIKGVDTELTEISKTAGVARDSLEDLGLAAYDTASKYGRAVTDYLKGIKEMTRAGFEGQASEDMAELSILAQSAGDMTSELSNEYLIATNAAYKLNGNVKELNAVLDGQNYVTNHNAVNMSQLAEATKIAGSQAATSGVKIDQLTAALGTMIATTQQGGETAARAFKGVMMNLQQVTAESDEIGDGGDAITTESLTKYEKACEDLGVSLKTLKNGVLSLRDPMEVLKDLAAAYTKEAEGSIKAANLINAVGGKYRGNQLDALLKNWSTYEKMLSEFNSSEAQGSALREANNIAPICRNVYQRMYLIAGNVLEPCTTIVGKPGYDGLKTQGLTVLAAKHPNVFRRTCGTLVEGERSTTRITSRFGQVNKGGNPEYPNQYS